MLTIPPPTGRREWLANMRGENTAQPTEEHPTLTGLILDTTLEAALEDAVNEPALLPVARRQKQLAKGRWHFGQAWRKASPVIVLLGVAVIILVLVAFTIALFFASRQTR